MTLFSRRHFLATCLSIVLLAATALSASARPINGVVAFGDSLTDNGNLSALTGGQFPAAKATGGQDAYFQGRLSNGPVWVEGLASALGVPLVDKAQAAAQTGTENNANALYQGLNAKGMQTQVGDYITANPTVNANNLYVLWGGANNYSAGALDPSKPVNDIAAQINALASAGATQFLVVNLPDLGSTPGGLVNPNSGLLNQLTAAHNAGLNTAINGIRQVRPGVDIKLLDVNALFKQVVLNKAAFGLTNVTTPYVQSGIYPGQGPVQGYLPTVIDPTADVNGYLFFDEIHPTAAAHSLIAQRALAVVVPEGGTLGLVGLGCSLLGAGVVVRRRRQA